ncbi:MAG: WD40 repeat domain-containing protein [Burkholderiaceae bacterium]
MSEPAPLNPFPGLRPFGHDEEHLFFGREAAVDAMVDTLARSRFLAVLGGSGSGKSSLVNCGLRPALHRGLMTGAGTAWRVAQCRPGADPLTSLAQALSAHGVLFADAAAAGASDAFPLPQLVDTTLRMSRLGLIDIVEQARLPAGVNVLVVVDQFEELFRYRGLSATADDAAAFVELLLQVRGQTACPVFVVLTMRSDFLGDCAAHPGLAEAINGGQFLVPRMTRDERRAAIAGPIGVAGGRISPVLLTRLMNDVGDDPDQLSILQHALRRTWTEWRRATGGSGAIELVHYEAVGTMAGALDRDAEDAWAQLPGAAERALCEQLFKALTDLATDPRGVRRPARLARLAAVTQAPADALRSVIDVFRAPDRSFLMPPVPQPLTDTTVIDISHESLMRVWSRLRAWAADEAESARQLRRLADAATLHDQGRGSLWRDPELAIALQWQSRQRPDAAWAEQYGVDIAPALAFLEASAAARSAALAAGRRRQARRRAALGAAIVVLTLLGGVFLALWQRTEALQERTAALLIEAQAANLRKMVLQSRAMLEGDVATTIDVALQLSAAGFRLGADNDSYGALQHALLRTAGLSKVVKLDAPVLAFSADQRSAATLHGATLRLADAVTGAPRGAPLQGHQGDVNCAAFSPDGATLASGGDDGTVRLWDAATGAARAPPLRGHTNRVWSVAFSPDGRVVASGSEDATVRLWDAASGAPLGVLTGHSLRVWSLAFSPDGRTLVSGSDDHSIRLWDLARGAPAAAPLLGHGGSVSSLAFSPDGRRLASGGGDNRVRLWDVASGRPVGDALDGHRSRIWSVAFSPDGRTLASAGEDQTVRLWDAATGQPRGEPLRGHKSRVWRIGFSADGASLLSGSNDRTLIRWNVAPASPAWQGHDGPVRSIAVSPDGATLATGGDDATVRLWDSETGAPRGSPLRGHQAGVTAVAISPDGRVVASASEDGSLRRWDLASGEPIGAAMQGQGGPVWSLAFSPDGETLASGSGDARLRLWDVASGQLRGEPQPGHSQRIWSVAFSPDGAKLATASDDTTLRLRDARTGAPLGEPLRGHSERVWSVAFSPDGRTLASASEDGSVRLWDVATASPRGEPLTGHVRAVTGVAFSPDGGSLASSSHDMTLRLWNARAGKALGAPLRGHPSAVAALAFGPAGRRLWSASEDGSVQRWDAPNAWIERVCAKLTHNLALHDWERLVGGIPYVRQCPDLPLAPE